MLEGVEKHFLPPTGSWLYERIRLGLQDGDKPSTELQKVIERNIQALKQQFLATTTTFNTEVQIARIGRYNSEIFFKKIEFLMLRVFKLNLSFLNRVGKGSALLLIEAEQKKTQNWLKESIINFLLKKSSVVLTPGHIIPGPSFDAQNPSSLSDMLEKITQEQSSVDEISGSLGTSTDYMIMQLALVVLGDYYKEVNEKKWNALFSPSLGSLEFVEFLVVCLNELNATKTIKSNRILGSGEMRRFFPWEDPKRFDTIPHSVRKFKSYVKSQFSILKGNFSNKQIKQS
ncbi:hypothetical protein O181_056480 [Austropuccinia psidii MF-1]|uniref:Uncharacterized protein n=1 Tax=Austropuccinia psidii MF-1 TaxID=1389203 RepID=A0A9Q3E673_9BASI|nr:hypothetical protein [Austropuccinia psidii MF-1]